MNVVDVKWQRRLKPGSLLSTTLLDRPKIALIIASEANVYMGMTQLRVNVLFEGSFRSIIMDASNFSHSWRIIHVD